MLDADFATILLPKQRAYYRLCLLTERMSGYVVRDCEEDEGVEESTKASVGGFGRRDERIGICHSTGVRHEVVVKLQYKSSGRCVTFWQNHIVKKFKEMHEFVNRTYDISHSSGNMRLDVS